MTTQHDILIEMDKILDQLVETAEKLCQLSKQGFEEDELITLQQAQEQMVNKLTTLDDAFKNVPAKGGSEPILRESIDQKIEEFQRLNSMFIDNIKTSHGFGRPKKKK